MSARSLRPEELAPLALDTFKDLGEALEAALSMHATSVQLVEYDRHTLKRTLKGRDIQIRARLLAKYLLQQGAGPGTRIALLLNNGPAWPIVVCATFMVRATLVPLDPKLEPEEWSHLLTHSGANFLAVEGSIYRRAERQGVTLPPALVVEPLSELRDIDLNLDDILDTDEQAMPQVELPPPVDRDHYAAIAYTSGTGGAPKGCCLTHNNYMKQAEVLSALFPFGDGDRFFSFLPTHHAIDFMTGLLIPLMTGGQTFYQRTLRPELLGWTIRKHKPTHLAAVPRILEVFSKKIDEGIEEQPLPKRLAIEALMEINARIQGNTPRPEWSRILLKPLLKEFGGSLRLIVAGGAPVPPKLADSLYRAGIPVAIGYGLTEAGTVLTVNRLDPFRSDTVGEPIPNVQLRIKDPNEEGIGEVVVKGPTIMAGYLDDPEATAERLIDGWLHTGDLGSVDETGHLRLHGRQRDMVVTPGGKNLYPEDLEQHFTSISGCEELAILPTIRVWPDTDQPETLILVARPDDSTDEATLLERLRERNRNLPAGRRVHALLTTQDEFPRTTSLKLRRAEFATDLREREADLEWLIGGTSKSGGASA